jgi:GTP 3',8-cyclase
MSLKESLVDAFGRKHSNLRISVTDRCNIRCFYCMPQEQVQFLPRAEILTFEEIERFVRVVVPLGINRLRLTGGEPLMRADLPVLVEKLAGIPGIVDLAMTTNGLLLAEQAAALRQAGLRRLNISLDGLTPRTFRQIARRDGLDKVLRGIAVAQQLGFAPIRLNTVALRGITEREIIPLAAFARDRHLELRFIEFMPLDADDRWQADQVLPGEQIRDCLESHFGPLIPAERTDPSQPAIDYQFADGPGRIGFINPVTQPFCADCNRVRISAEGQVRSCLFATQEWDARGLMRRGGSDQELAALVRACVGAKKPGHGIDSPEFLRPRRAMYELGG